MIRRHSSRTNLSADSISALAQVTNKGRNPEGAASVHSALVHSRRSLIVLNNAAEMAASAIAKPDLLRGPSRNAPRCCKCRSCCRTCVKQFRRPSTMSLKLGHLRKSVLDFMILWLGLLNEPARHCNFQAAIGSDAVPARSDMDVEGHACALRNRLCRRRLSCPTAPIDILDD